MGVDLKQNKANEKQMKENSNDDNNKKQNENDNKQNKHLKPWGRMKNSPEKLDNAGAFQNETMQAEKHWLHD